MTEEEYFDSEEIKKGKNILEDLKEFFNIEENLVFKLDKKKVKKSKKKLKKAIKRLGKLYE